MHHWNNIQLVEVFRRLRRLRYHHRHRRRRRRPCRRHCVRDVRSVSVRWPVRAATDAVSTSRCI